MRPKPGFGRGHRVRILLEAFAIDEDQGDLARYRHNASRGARVRSGNIDICVIAIFAADVISGCPNLGEGNACQIYEQRPLVCRIYPMEVNPFVVFRIDQKDCPPEAWETSQENEVIQPDGQVIPSIKQLVEASRRADQAEALTKVLICEELDLRVTAWKGCGYVIHTPDADALMAAISRASVQQRSPGKQWSVRVHDQRLIDELHDMQAQLYPENGDDRHSYIPLGRVDRYRQPRSLLRSSGKSASLWRSSTWRAVSALVWLTMCPLATAGRSAIAAAQRWTCSYSWTWRNSAEAP